MIDHVRDRFWLRDTSSAREQERRESLARTIAREHQRTGRPLQGPQRAQGLPGLAAFAAGLQRLAEALLAQRRGQEAPQAGAALNVRLYERERERDQGMSW